MTNKRDRLSYDIDEEKKTLKVEVFQIIEPEETNDYFWGKYPNEVLEDYRILHCTTGEPDPSKRINKLFKYLPFFSQEKEQLVVLVEKSKHREICKGDKFTAVLRPAWYGQGYPFTVLESVVA